MRKAKVILLALVAMSATAVADPEGRAARKTLAELINREDPAWPAIERAVADSHGRARIVPTTRDRGERTLVAMQYTTRSLLGAIAYQAGGLLIDHGWIRVLGAGGPTMTASLASVNGLDKHPTLSADAPGMIVAVDVLGGVFAINAGKLRGPEDNIFYLAPDTLEWMDMGFRYSTFIQWTLAGKVDEFYKTLRWESWQKDVDALPPDKGLQVLPPPFLQADAKLKVVRKPVPIDELWRFTIEMSHQTHDKGIRDGDKIRFKVVK